MPISINGKGLCIKGVEDVHELDWILPSVAVVKVSGLDHLRIPQLPSHVESLSLNDVLVLEGSILSEGLVQLSLNNVRSEVPFSEWDFPSTLKKLVVGEVHGDFIDLRAFPCDEIALTWSQRQTTLLPEHLSRLSISNYKAVSKNRRVHVTFDEDLFQVPRLGSMALVLPPYLDTLSLYRIAGVETLDATITQQVKSLELNYSLRPINVSVHFPNLTNLEIDAISADHIGPLVLPELRYLRIKYTGARRANANRDQSHIVGDLPMLESLSLTNAPGRKSPISFPGIDATLIDMTLRGVGEFPEGNNWQRLESLNISRATVKLPLMPRLQELDLYQPQMANGYEVTDIFEYRQAWGLESRRKRPQRSSESGY